MWYTSGLIELMQDELFPVRYMLQARTTYLTSLVQNFYLVDIRKTGSLT